MRRAVPGVVLLVFAAASVPAAQKTPESGRPADGTAVKMRGCVSGSLLKSVQADPATVVGSLTASDRYRMTGTKEVKNQIKKANGALVDITGRIKPGPQAMVKGTKMGNTTIGIGVTQGPTSQDPQMPYTPTVEVDGVEIVAPSCGPS
jgi:hypothetical protein